MKYPVTYLTACTKSYTPSCNKIFNVKDVPYYLWISIPSDVSKEFSLYAMNETTAKCNREVAIDAKSGIVQTQGIKPWIRITTAGISKAIGLHIYKLSFANKYTGDTVFLYFSYTIQCDDPCRPYDYMEEERCKCYGCVNCNICKQAVPVQQK